MLLAIAIKHLSTKVTMTASNNSEHKGYNSIDNLILTNEYGKHRKCKGHKSIINFALSYKL